MADPRHPKTRRGHSPLPDPPEKQGVPSQEFKHSAIGPVGGERDDGQDETHPRLLEAEGLVVRRGSREVLRDVGLTLREGEVLGILGPNGAGKSTLVEALLGLIPFEGSVCFEGQPIDTLSARERARALAYVPQRSMLQAELSVREVVGQGRYASGGSMRDSEVDAELERIGLTAMAERAFPTLSVGEQQRVLIARALATGARCLVLDEPTAALDVRRALETFALLRTLADEGRGVVVVVHGLEEARRATDHLLLLADGAVAASGSPAEVVAPGPIRRVYGVELVENDALGFRLSDGDQ
jgi:iron complex transport system ATP-binding protein